MITGVKDMSMAEYLAADGISQSSLKLLAKSPAHLKYAREHPEPSTPDQDMGTVLHKAVFEPDELKDFCHVIPMSYENEKGERKPWHGGANICKAWFAARQDGKIHIHQSDFSDVLLMRDSVHRHPAAAMALQTGKAEQSLFVEDPDTGLQLKCRTDWLSGNAVVDLKKCQDASPTGFARSVANFNYALQAAVNLHICKLLGLGKEKFIHVAIEDTPPYAVGVYELDQAALDVGYSQFRRLLARYLECVIVDQWPAYSPHIEYLSLPAWSAAAERNAMLLEDQPTMPALTVA